MDIRPVGVFDSGMGGISLLRNLRRILPGEDFVFYGDTANAPYGTKPESEILELAREDVRFLLKKNVKAIVIACNTATSAAAKVLRSEMDMPIIGIEPALKPAALSRKDGKIAVLATPATLRQQKFADLMQIWGEGAIPLPCPGLMEFAERGELGGKALDEFLSRLFEPLRGEKLDGAVLGCTHYTFLKNAISKALPGVPLFDGNEGTARQLKRVLTDRDMLSPKRKGRVELCTSGDPEVVMPVMKALMERPIEEANMAFDPKRRMSLLMEKAVPDTRYDGGDLSAWQARARAVLSRLTGYECERTEPNFRTEWTEKHDGCTETRFLFESEPDVTCAGHILIPDGAKKAPVIICLQGHSKGMHISLGRPKYEGDEANINGGDRDFARQIVKRGQIALALEQRGFGERGGTENGPACTQPAMQALLLGKTIIGQRCYDISRAIDVIGQHFPEADMDRIAIMGNSGGGTASIYAAALDTRIAAVMPSCSLCGFKASIGELNHCLCNYVPDIMNHFDMGDIAAMCAPRPYVAVNGETDGIFPLWSANEQFEIAKKAYAAAGAENMLRHVIGPEGHRFYADLSWPVFDEVTGWR